MRSPAALSPKVLSNVGDVELAMRMQLYEVARLFGETVITPSAATWTAVTLCGGFPTPAVFSATCAGTRTVTIPRGHPRRVPIVRRSRAGDRPTGRGSSGRD